MGEMRNAYKILIGKHKGKRQFRRPRHRWEDNIRMDCREVGWEGLDWMLMIGTSEALVNPVVNLWVP
jgi:hypothetical protein